MSLCPFLLPSALPFLRSNDLLAAPAELAGAKLPTDRPIDGRAFAPQLRGEKGRPREWCYNDWRGKAWARTHCFKLCRDGRLFDVEADPAEKHPSSRERVDRRPGGRGVDSRPSSRASVRRRGSVVAQRGLRGPAGDRAAANAAHGKYLREKP